MHVNSSDKSVFIKHGDIQDEKFRIKLDFMRDINNKLGLLSSQQHSERFEKISVDTLDQICKFHNINRDEIKNDFAQDKRYKVQDIGINLQVMVVAELWLNHQLFEPKMQTGVLSSYDLDHEIEFPIRVCDLTPNTHVGITIYDLSKSASEGPMASTMIDVFDSKTRMRQGTFNLFLWQKKELDMSLECSTPGLFYDKPQNLNDFEDESGAPDLGLDEK